MQAVCWYGKKDVRVQSVPDPSILNRHDAVIRVNLTAICGSDLHMYDGYIPGMIQGDILGHEFMGEVVETGPETNLIRKGDRVIVPFAISCGNCFYCDRKLYSLCDNTNHKAFIPEGLYGYSGAGLFGYSHIYGGYAGGQAEYVRIPFADTNALKIPEEVSDEKVLFLSDIFPTGYMAAEYCNIQGGEVVAIWGCGPVGQFAIRSALLLGAGRVIAIDRIPERLEMARRGGAETVDYTATDDLIEELKQMTGGRGPDACIDAVGMEAHGTTIDAFYDYAKQMIRAETDRPHVLREAIQACRKGGIVSIPGVYGGFIDKFPIGAAFAKGLTLRMGQTHVQKYMVPLMNRILKNEIDPSFVITHRLNLNEAEEGYKIFCDKQDECIKVVMRP